MPAFGQLLKYLLFIHLPAWGLNLGPCTCQASALSLSYILSPGNLFSKWEMPVTLHNKSFY